MLEDLYTLRWFSREIEIESSGKALQLAKEQKEIISKLIDALIKQSNIVLTKEPTHSLQDTMPHDMKLALIPGHTKNSPGACGLLPIECEYFWARDIVKRCKERNKTKNLKIREFLRDDIGIAGVYQEAINWDADACIEIHYNAFGNASVFGTEVLYNDLTAKLPTREKELAEIAQKKLCHVYSRPQQLGRGNRGKKVVTSGEAGFFNVTRTMLRPTILIEPFFGSNKVDAEKGHRLRDELADAIIETGLEWFFQYGNRVRTSRAEINL